MEPILSKKNRQAKKLGVVHNPTRNGYNQYPFFVKKNEEVEKLLERVGLPDEAMKKLKKL